MNTINRENVGRIAERIAANEFEARGFRVSDLNKEGLSANADLLAVKGGRAWQVQVKGATSDGSWWVSYGFASQEKIDRQKPMYNSTDSYYEADVVVLVCCSPRAVTNASCCRLPWAKLWRSYASTTPTECSTKMAR